MLAIAAILVAAAVVIAHETLLMAFQKQLQTFGCLDLENGQVTSVKQHYKILKFNFQFLLFFAMLLTGTVSEIWSAKICDSVELRNTTFIWSKRV